MNNKSAITEAAAPIRHAAGPSIAATIALSILPSSAALAGRLKAILFAFGRLALAQRMSAAQTEIERGKERLWLESADGEKTHLSGAAHEDIARAGTGRSGETKSYGRDGAKALERRQTTECEEPVLRNSSVMTDSVERYIAARAERFRGL